MPDIYHQTLTIPAGRIRLQAELRLPPGASAIIIFSQTGSSEGHRSRTRVMAARLEAAGLGTLLPEMFTASEGGGQGITYDLELLTHRLVAVTEWLQDRDLFGRYQLGFYGTGVGAAAALKAAASLGTSVGAIVCRGARPDLVRESLPYVEAPTLLIAGEFDRYILEFNREALDQLSGDRRLAIISGVAHNFSEPAKLEEAVTLTCDWFLQHLKPSPDVKPEARRGKPGEDGAGYARTAQTDPFGI